jgi:hypothetical protein
VWTRKDSHASSTFKRIRAATSLTQQATTTTTALMVEWQEIASSLDATTTLRYLIRRGRNREQELRLLALLTKASKHDLNYILQHINLPLAMASFRQNQLRLLALLGTVATPATAATTPLASNTNKDLPANNSNNESKNDDKDDANSPNNTNTSTSTSTSTSTTTVASVDDEIVGRLPDLDVISKCIILDALQKAILRADVRQPFIEYVIDLSLPYCPHADQCVACRNIMLSVKGEELSTMRTILDSRGEWHNLHKLVWKDVQDIAIRDRILRHIAENNTVALLLKHERDNIVQLSATRTAAPVTCPDPVDDSTADSESDSKPTAPSDGEGTASKPNTTTTQTIVAAAAAAADAILVYSNMSDISPASRNIVDDADANSPAIYDPSGTSLTTTTLLKILSDIDDTLFCSGGPPGGIDCRLPRHTLYPGVLRFYRELDLATDDMVERAKREYPVPLTLAMWYDVQHSTANLHSTAC